MLEVVRSGKFHGARFRGGMGGDQDVEFAGLIRHEKVSSLGNVTEMSGGARCAVAERPTKRACYFLRRVSEQPLEVEREGASCGGLRREGDGATELEGRADCLY